MIKSSRQNRADVGKMRRRSSGVAKRVEKRVDQRANMSKKRKFNGELLQRWSNKRTREEKLHDDEEEAEDFIIVDTGALDDKYQTQVIWDIESPKSTVTSGTSHSPKPTLEDGDTLLEQNSQMSEADVDAAQKARDALLMLETVPEDIAESNPGQNTATESLPDDIPSASSLSTILSDVESPQDQEGEPLENAEQSTSTATERPIATQDSRDLSPLPALIPDDDQPFSPSAEVLYSSRAPSVSSIATSDYHPPHSTSSLASGQTVPNQIDLQIKEQLPQMLPGIGENTGDQCPPGLVVSCTSIDQRDGQPSLIENTPQCCGSADSLEMSRVGDNSASAGLGSLGQNDQVAIDRSLLKAPSLQSSIQNVSSEARVASLVHDSAYSSIYSSIYTPQASPVAPPQNQITPNYDSQVTQDDVHNLPRTTQLLSPSSIRSTNQTIPEQVEMVYNPISGQSPEQIEMVYNPIPRQSLQVSPRALDSSRLALPYSSTSIHPVSILSDNPSDLPITPSTTAPVSASNPLPPQGDEPPVVFTIDNRFISSLTQIEVNRLFDKFAQDTAVLFKHTPRPGGRTRKPKSYTSSVLTTRTLPEFYEWYAAESSGPCVSTLRFELPDTNAQYKDFFLLPYGDLDYFRALKQYIWDFFWQVSNAHGKKAVPLFRIFISEEVNFPHPQNTQPNVVDSVAGKTTAASLSHILGPSPSLGLLPTIRPDMNNNKKARTLLPSSKGPLVNTAKPSQASQLEPTNTPRPDQRSHIDPVNIPRPDRRSQLEPIGISRPDQHSQPESISILRPDQHSQPEPIGILRLDQRSQLEPIGISRPDQHSQPEPISILRPDQHSQPEPIGILRLDQRSQPEPINILRPDERSHPEPINILRPDHRSQFEPTITPRPDQRSQPEPLNSSKPDQKSQHESTNIPKPIIANIGTTTNVQPLAGKSRTEIEKKWLRDKAIELTAGREDLELEDDETSDGRRRAYPEVCGAVVDKNSDKGIVVVTHRGFPILQVDTGQGVIGERYAELIIRTGQSCIIHGNSTVLYYKPRKPLFSKAARSKTNYRKPSENEPPKPKETPQPQESSLSRVLTTPPFLTEITIRLQIDSSGKFSEPFPLSAFRSKITTTLFFEWFASHTSRGGDRGPPFLTFTFKDAMPVPKRFGVARGAEDDFKYMRNDIMVQWEMTRVFLPKLGEFSVLVTDPEWIVDNVSESVR